MDFAVWKAKKEGEPAWQTPWGEGRPGWHIECSVMANEYLGKTIDIHCGGKDLSFPHHENEIAQSEAANGVPFANYWMHNGYINIDNRKMSKSLNNFFTVRDLSKKYDYSVIRFFMLCAHYRSPINFSDELLEQAKTGLHRIITCRKNLEFLSDKAADTAITDEEKNSFDTYRQKFVDAMDDDLNTAEAIGVIFELVRDVNIHTKGNVGKGYVAAAGSLFQELTEVLGIAQMKEENGVDVSMIEELIAKRTAAKKEKNFQQADEIRAQLFKMGIILEDTREGVKWHKAD